jgi:hypothetical protein
MRTPSLIGLRKGKTTEKQKYYRRKGRKFEKFSPQRGFQEDIPVGPDVTAHDVQHTYWVA